MQPKYLLLLSSFFPAAFVNAQFVKGTHVIGTSIGSAFFSSGKTEYSFPNGTAGYTTNNNNSTISLSPSAGCFLSKNSVAGLNLILSNSHQKTWMESSGTTYREDNSNNTDFGLGIFYRYYFSVDGRVKPFAHAYVNGGSGTTKTDGFYYALNYSQAYTGKSSDRFFYNLGLNAGITKIIGRTIGLEGFVGYAHSLSKFTTTTVATTNSNGAITTSEYQPTQKFTGNGVTVGIGVQLFLPHKASQ